MDEQQRALRAEVAELRARLSAIESQIAGDPRTTLPEPVEDAGATTDPGPPPEPTPEPDVPRTTDRRSALKLAGAAAAGLAGGAVVAGASPAAAANGENLVLGTTNSATSTTTLTGATLAVSAINPLSATTTTGTGLNVGVNGGIGARLTFNDGTGLVLDGGSGSGASIRFPDGAIVPPSSGTWARGDVVGSPLGLWFCYVAGVGTASKWVKISSALVTLPVPVRVYDSRPGQPPVAIGPKSKLVAATPRTIDCKGNGSGVPAGISSVLLNVVVTGTTTGDPGYLAVYKAGVPFPNTSSLNWSAAGQNVAVTTVSAVDTQSQIAVWAASATDVVIDVIGFYP